SVSVGHFWGAAQTGALARKIIARGNERENRISRFPSNSDVKSHIFQGGLVCVAVNIGRIF
ncbi:MAG: hypothetical protein WA426_12050, partial [Silvibacterium sp.]